MQSLEREISSSDPVNAVEITELEAAQSTTQQPAAQSTTQQIANRKITARDYEIIEEDRFAKESTPAAYDLIIGFQVGIDKIDLSAMKISNKAQNYNADYVV